MLCKLNFYAVGYLIVYIFILVAFYWNNLVMTGLVFCHLIGQQFVWKINLFLIRIHNINITIYFDLRDIDISFINLIYYVELIVGFPLSNRIMTWIKIPKVWLVNNSLKPIKFPKIHLNKTQLSSYDYLLQAPKIRKNKTNIRRHLSLSELTLYLK